MTSDMVNALRATALKMSAKPWTTGVEDAFRMLADELERAEKNLDPRPYVYVGPIGNVPVERQAMGAEQFFGPDKVRFEPREGYEQDKEKYK